MLLQEIQIELAGVCNARCVYCTWQKRTTAKRMMDTELALRLLADAREMGVTVVRYHGLGESLLHPDLTRIIAFGEQLVFDHSISTNCYSLGGFNAAILGDMVNLSVVLAVPWVERPEFVDVCVTNAKEYLEHQKNKRVHIQMVCHEDCRDSYRRCVDEFMPFVECEDNVFLHLKQPVTWPNDTPNVGFADHELRGKPGVIFDDRATPMSIAVGCSMPHRFLMIMADGTCVPCCVGMDDWGLGLIGDRSLREVWESDRMAEIRQMWRHADDSIPCGYCKKRTDCLQ